MNAHDGREHRRGVVVVAWQIGGPPGSQTRSLAASPTHLTQLLDRLPRAQDADGTVHWVQSSCAPSEAYEELGRCDFAYVDWSSDAVPPGSLVVQVEPPGPPRGTWYLTDQGVDGSQQVRMVPLVDALPKGPFVPDATFPGVNVEDAAAWLWEWLTHR